jgi:gliding motility-associated lipoprotein GldH
MLVLAACGSGNMQPQHFYQGFKNNAWPIGNTISFSFEVTDTSKVCDITANLRYNDTFSFSSLNLSVVMLTPSGSSRFSKIVLPITKANGDRNGIRTNDYIGLPFDVYKSVRFAEKGTWVLNFNHTMPVDIFRGLIGLEINILPQ